MQDPQNISTPNQPRSVGAIIGLIVGIVALLGSWVPIFNNFAFILALVGLVFSIVGLVGVLRGKKSGKGLSIAAVIVCVLSCAVVLGTQSMFSAVLDAASGDVTEDVTTAESNDSKQPAEEAKYVISGEKMTKDSYSQTIAGTFTNNTDEEMEYVSIEYILLDKNGDQLGTAIAATNNLKAGGTWKFEAVGFEDSDKVKKYERADVTAY